MIERRILIQWSSSESTKSFKWRIDNFDDCKNCLNDNQKNLKDLIHDNQISIDSIFIHLFFYLIFWWLISWKRNEIKRKDIKNESIRMNNDQITFFLIKTTLFFNLFFSIESCHFCWSSWQNETNLLSEKDVFEWILQNF